MVPSDNIYCILLGSATRARGGPWLSKFWRGGGWGGERTVEFVYFDIFGVKSQICRDSEEGIGEVAGYEGFNGG